MRGCAVCQRSTPSPLSFWNSVTFFETNLVRSSSTSVRSKSFKIPAYTRSPARAVHDDHRMRGNVAEPQPPIAIFRQDLTQGSDGVSVSV